MQGTLGTGGNVLSPRELTPLLIRLYCSKPKLSILLIGKHGVGKSTIVRDVAKYLADHPCPGSTNPGSTKKEFVEINKIRSTTAKTGTNKVITYEDVYLNPRNYFLFYDLRLTELEPQDLMGLPRITSLNIDREYHSVTTYAPPSWAMLLSIPDIDGILFLDELTNVQRTDVISAAYKLFLDKSSGNLRFSDNVMVVSAGNPVPSASSQESVRYGVANPLPAPLLNRVIVIGVKEPDIEEWREYMDQTYTKEGKRTWDYTVYEFLKAYGKEYGWSGSEVTRTHYGVYENEPTPRSFTNLALISGQLHDNTEQLRSVAIGLLGGVVGEKFVDFVKSKQSVTAQDLLQNPMLILQNEYQPSVIAELAHAIATMYRTNNKQAVINFVLTVLRNLPKAQGSVATGAKDLLLTIYSDLTVQEKTELINVLANQKLLNIWYTLTGR